MATLVTGGAGYIGSHVVHALRDAGEKVIVVDNLSTGVRENLPTDVLLLNVDCGAIEDAVFADHDIDAVIHFAGSIVVPESVTNPLKYYRNNTSESAALLDACVRNNVSHFIFSSTAAVYGEPDVNPISEATPLSPINPYGRSKRMVEWLLEDTDAAHPLNYVALRYFNVAGADPAGRTGQSTPEATHLIKIAAQAAIGEREKLSVFGTDYPTPDGTCIRDYIHVTDLAAAHLRALDYLRAGGTSTKLNCGYGRGFSVREVIEEVLAHSPIAFPVVDAPRRDGDPPALVADATKIAKTLDWKPEFDDLSVIVKSALDWETKLRDERTK